MVDSTNPRKAAYYYLATAELHETEKKFREAANATKSAVNMWARAKEYETLIVFVGAEEGPGRSLALSPVSTCKIVGSGDWE